VRRRYDVVTTQATKESLQRWSIRNSGGKRGKEITAEYAELIRELKDAQPVLTLCAFCEDFCDGTLAEGRAWHEEHRAEHGVKPQRRKANTRSFINGTSLEHNIAAVRQQGGHHWEDTT
jgi:hypothetical protein